MAAWKCILNILVLVNFVFSQEIGNDTSDIFTHDKSAILSRKKRFLIFPEGSSFQLGKT